MTPQQLQIYKRLRSYGHTVNWALDMARKPKYNLDKFKPPSNPKAALWLEQMFKWIEEIFKP